MVKFHAFKMGALSCLGLIITGTDVLAASGLPTFREGHELYTLLLILVIAVAVGLFMIRRRNKIELNLTDNTDSTIEFGDIFNESGLIVIPVNEYFDTIVDNRIIGDCSPTRYTLPGPNGSAQGNSSQSSSQHQKAVFS